MLAEIPTQICDLAMVDFATILPIDAAMEADSSLVNHVHPLLHSGHWTKTLLDFFI